MSPASFCSRVVVCRICLRNPVTSIARNIPTARRQISTTKALEQRRNDNLQTGYTSQYSVSSPDNGRGPIFDKREPNPLYPRDIKERVDAYVVGQEKAKVRIL